MKLANIKKQIASQLDNVTDSSVEFYKDLIIALASNPTIVKDLPDIDVGCDINSSRNVKRIINQADAIIKQLESDLRIKKEK